jgi:hypothetical protein
MKSYVWILSLIFCCGLNAQDGNIHLSRWHVSDKVESSEFQPIRKLKLQYFLSNDNDNFYVDLRVVDHLVQDKILREGLTIWINMDGTQVKRMGVRFPLGSQNSGDRRKADHQENNPNPQVNGNNPISLANTIELRGFINEVQRHFPSDNHDNFRGSVKYDPAGVLYYKLIMPIAKLPVRNSRGGHGTMPFTLGIEYGSLPNTYKQGENRGPRPSALFHSDSSGSNGSKLQWIYNVKLVSSK